MTCHVDMGCTISLRSFVCQSYFKHFFFTLHMSYMVFGQITDLTNIVIYINIKDTLLIISSINATCFVP